MSEKKKTSFGKNLILNNPVFSLYLGICSTLAISTSLNNALGMGLAVTAVLICSNVLVSIVAKITPDDVHIPVYIVIIATLVTIVEMFMHAYTADLYASLGAFLDLIVVNCIILGRAEAFACQNPVGASAMDGLQMGLAYTCSLLAMSLIRQILGTGVLSMTNPFTNATIFSIRLLPKGFEMGIFTSQTGAFFTFATLAALVAIYKESQNKPGKKEAK